eukprot:1146781-Pelagomonas_calceolata.AAC.6
MKDLEMSSSWLQGMASRADFSFNESVAGFSPDKKVQGHSQEPRLLVPGGVCDPGRPIIAQIANCTACRPAYTCWGL